MGSQGDRIRLFCGILDCEEKGLMCRSENSIDGLIWVGLYEAGLSDEWIVRVVGFPSLDAFKQRLA